MRAVEPVFDLLVAGPDAGLPRAGSTASKAVANKTMLLKAGRVAGEACGRAGLLRDGRYWARTSDPQLVEPAHRVDSGAL
jgi:hypothetical protein